METIWVGRSCGVLFGGNANNGANAGFAYANSNNAPSNSNANIGSHLCFSIGSSRIRTHINNRRTATLPLGKKIQNNQKGVGRKALNIGLSKTPIKKSKAMKRIGNLYERIISIENLTLADTKARRGKKKSYGVRHHDKSREENIIRLHEALRQKTFRTSEYDKFTVFEPKERLIYRLPYYPDRIVHHAVMNILEPIWMSVFTHNTYSCVKKRGIEGCARQVEKIIRKYNGKTLYCLKIDIRKFYPSINHDVMKRIVRRKIKDKDLLWLLDEIIDSTEGLPIGNYLSQFLANLFLSYFMHFVNEELKLDATEYADDICFFSESKGRLHESFKEIRSYLADLDLEVKGNYQVFPIAKNRYDKGGRALDYVGYKFYREQKLIRKSIKKRFCKHVARLNKRANLSEKDYKQDICAWLGWAKHSNSRHLLKTIIKKEYYDSIL